MKVLYVSSWHPSLEKNDLDALSALGISWVSTGIYLNPETPHSTCMRGPIKCSADPKLIDRWISQNPNYNTPRSPQRISRKFADNFDVIVINNFVGNLKENWENIKHKPVIFRTYDGHTPGSESYLKYLKNTSTLKVVRLFEFETRIPYACPTDLVIPNYVEVEEYNPWAGDELKVLTFNNDFMPRLNALDRFGRFIYPGMRLYLDLIKRFDCVLYGMGNPADLSAGFCSYEMQKLQYQHNRVYFSIGSKPGPYTYSWLEAMAAGIPTVNFGMGLGDYDVPEYKYSYEVPSIIENGVTGYCSDNIEELCGYIEGLLSNKDLARSISKNSVELVKKKFSKELAVNKWAELFKSL